MMGLMSVISWGEMENSSALAQIHSISVFFYFWWSSDPIFIGWMRLSTSWITSKSPYGIGLTSHSNTSRLTIFTHPRPSSDTPKVVRRFSSITSWIHLAYFRSASGTVSFLMLLWYLTLRWTREATTSNVSKKDLPKMPLKVLLHVTTRKLRVTFLSPSPSLSDSGKFSIPQGRVT